MTHGKRSSYNRGCKCTLCTFANTQYAKANKARYREVLLKSKYNISSNEFELMLGQQKGACAICRKPQEESLAVDHDHKTNKIRGLLCDHCNSGLGFFRDSPENLKRAAEYLINGPELIW